MKKTNDAYIYTKIKVYFSRKKKKEHIRKAKYNKNTY